MALNAYIVEAVRTPAGRKNGLLSAYHPCDLGGKETCLTIAEPDNFPFISSRSHSISPFSFFSSLYPFSWDVAVVIDAILDRTGINPAEVDDVIFGCVSQVGAQAGNLARGYVLWLNRTLLVFPEEYWQILKGPTNLCFGIFVGNSAYAAILRLYSCVLSSKLPITVPGTTVDRQCGSSQQVLDCIWIAQCFCQQVVFG